MQTGSMQSRRGEKRFPLRLDRLEILEIVPESDIQGKTGSHFILILRVKSDVGIGLVD